MYQEFRLMTGVTLRCVEAQRFKQGCLSIQFLRPLCMEEVSMNALIPAILLRGTVGRPNIRSITQHLDDLYGVSVGELVRRVGDYQSIGLIFRFIEDRFVFSGDRVLEPVLEFAKELLLEPLVEDGGFCKDYVASEKRNLIDAIESQLNDKRAYAAAQLVKKMCRGDSFGIPLRGTTEKVEQIDPVFTYEHYHRVLAQSPVEVFYVGSADPLIVAQKIREIFLSIDRNVIDLPDHSAFRDEGGGDYVETMEISQARLSMGFTTPITINHDDFAVVQVLNYLFGGGMTSKLFKQVRETMSLSYAISSAYYASKGIVAVHAGIDSDKSELVKQEVLNQLQLCCEGDITKEELNAAKEALLSSLSGIYDSPGAIEAYESSMTLGPRYISRDEYRRRIQAVTLQQVIEAAKTLTLHTTYFLKGVDT